MWAARHRVEVGWLRQRKVAGKRGLPTLTSKSSLAVVAAVLVVRILWSLRAYAASIYPGIPATKIPSAVGRPFACQ